MLPRTSPEPGSGDSETTSRLRGTLSKRLQRGCRAHAGVLQGATITSEFSPLPWCQVVPEIRKRRVTLVTARTSCGTGKHTSILHPGMQTHLSASGHDVPPSLQTSRWTIAILWLRKLRVPASFTSCTCRVQAGSSFCPAIPS